MVVVGARYWLRFRLDRNRAGTDTGLARNNGQRQTLDTLVVAG